MATNLAPLQVSSLTFSTNRTGCQFASALCGPSICRYYPVAKNPRIENASQLDFNHSFNFNKRPPPHTALCLCTHAQAVRSANLYGAVPS